MIFNGQMELLQHQYIVHNEAKYICKIDNCYIVYPNQAKLTRHQQSSAHGKHIYIPHILFLYVHCLYCLHTW